MDASLLLDNSINGILAKGGSTAQPDAVDQYLRSPICGELSRQLGIVSSSYDASKANTTNRNWSFGQRFSPAQGTGGNNQRAKYETTDASVGSNTTTRTYLDSLTGLEVGTWLLKNSTTTATYEVTAIGADYIDHTALAAPLGTTDYFQKSKTQAIYIFEKSTGTTYTVPYSELSTNSDNTASVTLKTSAETTLGMTDFIHPEDCLVYATVQVGVGRCLFPSTGAMLGSVNSTTNYNDNPVQVIYELLFQAGFYDNEDYYDTDSFEAVSAAIDITISAANPRNAYDSSRSTYREVLAKVCETAMLKVFMKNGKWFVDMIEPLGSADYSIGIENVRDGMSYDIIGEEIVQETIVRYNFGEVNEINENTEHYSYVSSENSVTEALNNNTKSLTLDLYLSDETISQTVCDRYNYLFSYPVGTLTLEFDLSKIDINLGDVIEVRTEGFGELPFSSDKKFSVVSIREKSDSITVELFDQRGIEENSGSW